MLPPSPKQSQKKEARLSEGKKARLSQGKKEASRLLAPVRRLEQPNRTDWKNKPPSYSALPAHPAPPFPERAACKLAQKNFFPNKRAQRQQSKPEWSMRGQPKTATAGQLPAPRPPPLFFSTTHAVYPSLHPSARNTFYSHPYPRNAFYSHPHPQHSFYSHFCSWLYSIISFIDPPLTSPSSHLFSHIIFHHEQAAFL